MVGKARQQGGITHYVVGEVCQEVGKGRRVVGEAGMGLGLAGCAAGGAKFPIGEIENNP